MKVCLYGELSSILRGSGIGTAIDQQEKALRLNGVEVTRNHRESYDIIDINTIGPRSAYVAHKMRWKNVPVVIHSHTTVEDLKGSFRYSSTFAPKLRGYLRYFYDQADLIVSPTEYTKGVLQAYGVKRDIRVISNGVDTERFRFSENRRRQTRRLWGLKGIVPYSVGHIFKRKGIIEFMELAREFPNIAFMWVGRNYKGLVEGEIRKAVEAKPDNVMFTGYIKDVIGTYSAGDIFLFPSWCENQGIALLEAAACRRPLLVRDIPAYDGWLKDGDNCLKARDNEEFAEHLQRLIGDKRLRDRLAASAHRMSKKHALKRVGLQLKKAYEVALRR